MYTRPPLPSPPPVRYQYILYTVLLVYVNVIGGGGGGGEGAFHSLSVCVWYGGCSVNGLVALGDVCRIIGMIAPRVRVYVAGLMVPWRL
jgi:hypothetical protein